MLTNFTVYGSVIAILDCLFFLSLLKALLN